MKITFQVEYKTAWGESVEAELTYQSKTGKETNVTLPLTTTDGAIWRGEHAAPTNAVALTYAYRIVRDGKTKRKEWSVNPHSITLPAAARLVCHDRWRDMPTNAYRYTSAFTKAFARHQTDEVSSAVSTSDTSHTAQPVASQSGQHKTSAERPATERWIRICVEASEVPEGQTLVVLGNQNALGNWQIKNAVRLTEDTPNVWSFTIDANDLKGDVEYKFFTIDATNGNLIAWENRSNRTLTPMHIEDGEYIIVQDDSVNLPNGDWRGAGCVIPIFSLRSEQSYGVGDFGDLKRMIDWIALTGQRVLQILPINDTTLNNTWTDSYPYNSISIYAFHPMYVDLNALPELKDVKLRTAYKAQQRKLNALPQVDYVKVNDVKRSYLRSLFEQEGGRTLASKAYKDFYQKNAYWLTAYAAFSYLRDTYGTPDFHYWDTLSTYDADEVAALQKRGSKSATEMDFYCYIQYLLHVQLTDASNYARSKGVVIKGDIPIGISRCSVEAWVEPHYFNLNGQAGAPPDAFSVNGQNWGFPTYNWERMLSDGCLWWQRRFRKMAEYFDAYRIDHVLGFFRIWEIPLDSVHGLLGQFSPAMPMSVEEIESFGLTWHDNFLEPYIADWVINTIFGDYAEEVKQTYLDEAGYGLYHMKEGYDTQRKVEAAFREAVLSDNVDEAAKATKIRDGLYSLISNVLFVRDRKDQDMYHPRISAQDDFFYKTLNDADKQAFNNLYNHYFYHRHNQFWYGEAMKKLPVLTDATRMLVCAEDLGMVPDCVPWVMNDLRILTLEIQSMPKTPGYAFGHLPENPYRSVATISTHDMPTLRGWWDEDPALTQKFFVESLGHNGPAPHPLPGWLAEEVVTAHLACPSMLCLLSLQDWLSIDEERRYPEPDYERINVPANPRNYWRYRMHMTIEQLIADTTLNEKLSSLIKASGR